MRTSSTSVLRALGSLPPETFGGQLCPGNGFFEGIKDTICAELDVMTNPGQDFSGSACDAISAGFAFVAEPAHLQPPSAPIDAGLKQCSVLPSCN